MEILPSRLREGPGEGLLFWQRVQGHALP